jgi:DNA invertase Pin-like site-specific DNA recombinase
VFHVSVFHNRPFTEHFKGVEAMVKPMAAYVRVSTTEQHPEAQLQELRSYAARRGVELLEYVDHGISGRNDRRPALNELMTACRNREVSGVVVVRLDRLARSLVHMAKLGEELTELGIELVSLRESIDTSTATGRAMFGMCSVFSALEADLIRDRTIAGLAAAKKRGQVLGRKPALSQSDRQRAARLKNSGHSIRAIAGQLECGVATVHRALQS